ncbi:hypothetical protein [Gloeocapsopsis dulcis]|uniref:Uncharacterized protein n=1 Tax=Gloeocapsopsis dulcis AAB1 = 1H9 TaxID=1433147 RepID=A0A6N8FUU8_9CHRO|nr:hypothetical protein [Gloeocapsopsis dulcis]MUL36095.1 hypothetical protein [Gloeocapsopsis dulcis AAB1 = 1H9]WNN91433.1 hypothetical protein P0S91_10320 [Gloeocapsopsis dulcis]
MLKKVVFAMPSLETTLKLDSFVCVLSGIILLLASHPIAKLLVINTFVMFGLTLPDQLKILGIGLLVVGMAVYAVASYRPINAVAVWTIILIEIDWIIASVILLFSFDSVLTLAGKDLIAFSAIAVLAFMILEIYGLKQLRSLTKVTAS